MRLRKKKFWKMTFREKLAKICGYEIWEDDVVARWTTQDIDFYYSRIYKTSNTFMLIFTMVVGIVVTLFLGWLFFMR